MPPSARSKRYLCRLDYYPKSLSEVESVTPQITHQIRNQYILAYTPLNAALDGTFRAIKVT